MGNLSSLAMNEKLQKASVLSNLVMSDCLSGHMEHLSSHWMDFCEVIC